MASHRMGRAAGTVVITEPGKPVKEGDTLQCVHCGGHFYTKPGSGKQRGWCMRCNGPHCGAKGCWDCIPFMKKIEEMERKQVFARNAGLVMK